MACRILLICSLPPARAVFPADEPAAPAALARLAPEADSGVGADVRAGADIRECRVSPLRRAAQTADALGLAAFPDPALAEMDFGAWAGRSPDSVLADDPAGFARWQGDPEAAPHGGESLAAVAARMATWLQARAEAGGSLLAVSHPAPIQAALLHVLGAPLTSARAIGVRPLARVGLSHDGRRWSLMLAP